MKSCSCLSPGSESSLGGDAMLQPMEDGFQRRLLDLSANPDHLCWPQGLMLAPLGVFTLHTRDYLVHLSHIERQFANEYDFGGFSFIIIVGAKYLNVVCLSCFAERPDRA